MTTDGTSVAAALVLAGLAGALLPAAAARSLARLDHLDHVARPRRGWQVRDPSGRRAAARTSDSLGELAAALVAELRSGAEPRPAMRAAGAGLAGLEPLVAAATGSAGDVTEALATLGRAPGGSTASALAAAWRVGELTGCGLSAPVARVLRAHRAQERLRREVAAELAGPVATAYLLAVLPMLGVAMGTALGASPMVFLLGTGPGRWVLLAGVALDIAGMVWTRRIAAAAARPAGAE